MTKVQGRGGESLNHDQGGADQAMLPRDAARYSNADCTVAHWRWGSGRGACRNWPSSLALPPSWGLIIDAEAWGKRWEDCEAGLYGDVCYQINCGAKARPATEVKYKKKNMVIEGLIAKDEAEW